MLKSGKVYGGTNPRTLRTMSPAAAGGPPYPNWPLWGGEYPARRPGRSPPVGGALHQRGGPRTGLRDGVFLRMYAGLCFCQNGVISHGGEGKKIAHRTAGGSFPCIAGAGGVQYQFGYPTQYLPWILEALNLCRERLAIRYCIIPAGTSGWKYCGCWRAGCRSPARPEILRQRAFRSVFCCAGLFCRGGPGPAGDVPAGGAGAL